MCLVWISKQTGIISVYRISGLFKTKEESVLIPRYKLSY